MDERNGVRNDVRAHKLPSIPQFQLKSRLRSTLKLGLRLRLQKSWEPDSTTVRLWHVREN